MRTREWGSTDFYAVLGVPPSAPGDEIAAAYRARAKELHPDSRPDDQVAAEQFKDVSAAYRVLSEPETRREYDTYRRLRPPAGVPRVRCRGRRPRRPGRVPNPARGHDGGHRPGRRPLPAHRRGAPAGP